MIFIDDNEYTFNNIVESVLELYRFPLLIVLPKDNEYDAIILSVAHKKIIALGADKIREFGKPTHILYDLKYLFSKNETDIRL